MPSLQLWNLKNLWDESFRNEDLLKMSNEDMRQEWSLFCHYQITVVFKVHVTVAGLTNTFHCCFHLEFGQQQAWSNCSASHIMRPSCVPESKTLKQKSFSVPSYSLIPFLLPYTFLSLFPLLPNNGLGAPLLHSSSEPLTDLAPPTLPGHVVVIVVPS